MNPLATKALRSVVDYWYIVVILVLVASLGLQARRAGHWRTQAQVAEANERAALDTTRTYLADTVAAYSRLALQREADMDSLGAAHREALDDLGATLRALQNAEVRIDSLVVVAATPVTDTIVVEGGEEVRVATFTMEGPPISGQQDVRVSSQITLDSRLSVSPFSIGYSMACADNAPLMTWQTPAWVQVSLDEGSVDPLICNPPQRSLLTWGTDRMLWGGAGILTGLVLASLLGG